MVVEANDRGLVQADLDSDPRHEEVPTMSGRLALQHAVAQPHATPSRVSVRPSALAIYATATDCGWSNVNFDATTMGHKPASPRLSVSPP